MRLIRGRFLEKIGLCFALVEGSWEGIPGKGNSQSKGREQ